MRSDVYTTVER